MSEAKKTDIYEVCEQLGTLTGDRGEWAVPDAVFVPADDGCIIGAVHKGLRDARALGWIDALPHIYGIQAKVRHRSHLPERRA